MDNKSNYISDKYKISRSNDILDQDMQDELIILNMKDENYLGLDETGTRFWKVLLNSSSVKDAYEKLLDEYEVEPETLHSDLNEFIGNLEKNGLITILT